MCVCVCIYIYTHTHTHTHTCTYVRKSLSRSTANSTVTIFMYRYVDRIILRLSDLVKCDVPPHLAYLSISDYVIRANSFMRLYSLPSALDRVVRFTTSPFNPQGKHNRYSLVRSLDGTQSAPGHFGREKTPLLLPGMER